MTAIFVHSDTMAIGVLSALASAGRRVPADVAVVSCDDMPFAEYLTPSLSSLRVPFAETGRAGRGTAPAQHRRGARAGVHRAAAGRADRPRLVRRPGRQHQPSRPHLIQRQPGAPREAEGGFVTRIVVDPARQIGSVDRNVFGGFVEHLGRCIYGGLYDEGSPLADDRGFRTDVLGLLRELRHGRAALAGRQLRQQLPLDRRHRPEGRPAPPPRAGLGRARSPTASAPTSSWPTAGELGTEPYVCLNMGTGTLEEALAWVEYCNGAGDTAWAQRRRDNGHPEPYGVRYWGLGNEMYGDWQVGAVSAEEYVRDRDPVGPGDQDARPAGQAGQLRDERLERLGPGGHRRAGPPGRLPLAAHLHRVRRLLDERAPAAPGRARDPVRPGAHRAGRVREEDRPPAADRLRRVERLVPHRRRHAGGAVQLPGRAGRGHLPEHLHPELRLGADGQPGPDGERDRADRHHRPTRSRSSRSTTRCCCTPGPPWTSRSTFT